MFPSSSRVKLNRVAFKEGIGRSPAPRRRRVQKSPDCLDLTGDCKKADDKQLVSEPETTEGPGCLPSSHGPVQIFLKDEEVGLGNVADTPSDFPLGEQPPGERSVHPQEDERGNAESSTGNERMELKQEGPLCNGDVGRNTPQSSTGLPGSGGSLRRARRASGCATCGGCKYISPQRRRLGKQGQKSSTKGSERPKVEGKLKEKKQVTETSQKIIVWINQYPKVRLCDVARIGNAFSQDCGYVLPDALKTKVVRCFKRDMRAGFQLRPSCSGLQKTESENPKSKNTDFCPEIISEKNICQSQSQTEHLKECRNAQTLNGPTRCPFLGSGTSEDSGTSSAFFLGKRTKKAECRTSMLDKDVEVVPGPGPTLIASQIPTDKRLKLGDSNEGGILHNSADLDSVGCKDPAKTGSRDEENMCLWLSEVNQSCLERGVGGYSTFGSAAATESCVSKEPCSETENPTEADVAHMSPGPSCQRNKVEMDESESFTCQRVRAYFRKINFSCARTHMSWPFTHSVKKTHPADPIDQSTRVNCDFPINQKQPGLSSIQTNDMFPGTSTTHQVSHTNEPKRAQDGDIILAERNGKSYDGMPLDGKDKESAPLLMEAEEPLASLPSDTSTPSDQSRRGRERSTDTTSGSAVPINEPKTDSSTSTLSPRALCRTEGETSSTSSPLSSPLTHGGLGSLPATPASFVPPSQFLEKTLKDDQLVYTSPTSSPQHMFNALEKAIFYCEETRMTPSHSSDSLTSWESSLLLPQDEQERNEERLTPNCPPTLEPYYNTSPNLVQESMLQNVLSERDLEMDLYGYRLPPVLSPVSSPPGCSRTRLLFQNYEQDRHAGKLQTLPQCLSTLNVNDCAENLKERLEQSSEDSESVSTNISPEREQPSSPGSDTGGEEDVEGTDSESEQVSSDPEMKTSGAQSEPHSSRSSDEEDCRDSSEDEGSRPDEEDPSETSDSESDGSEANAADEPERDTLDEFTAYVQDILLVDVTQEDPELFENLPRETGLKLGPTRVTVAPKTSVLVKTLSPKTYGASLEFKQRLRQLSMDVNDCNEESHSRPWRPKCSSSPPNTQGNTWPSTEKQTRRMNQSDVNNNHVNGGLERFQPIQTVNSQHTSIPPIMTVKNGSRIINTANVAEVMRQKSTYCRQYFSESLSCNFKLCWFLHVPTEGDEMFCIDTVTRFTKHPKCLRKAGEVFIGYYQQNPPGAYFSMPVLLSLSWALLKAGMVSEVFSVLNVSLAHGIVPDHEFLLALFNFVREKGLMGFAPELMQITCKMAKSGLVLSLDGLDCVKNTPEFQQTIHPNSAVSLPANNKLSSSVPFPEYLNLAHAIVEIELCTKLEDWRRMGEVFRSVCQSSQRPNQLERISGRVAIALLSESKDKLSLPFAAFTETLCQNEGEDSLMRSFLGRIGVSLMFRYHKTHQWGKGRKVVEVLSLSKVHYSTLKGLFGNEDGASRCSLVTVATELCLLSGSLEGALKTLRDLESRTRVLMRLAERTSHRDTLEVLSNLPGLKEPSDLIDTSMYCPLFDAHLKVCVDRQTLPVAADTVDLMLSKSLPVDYAMLQTLFHKLGKQKMWLRARDVFKHCVSTGYYPCLCAAPGATTLLVPSRLGEVELALSFEMFMTVNATAILHLPENTTATLSITLRRTQTAESEYLSAGSRLLSAACIPQPTLTVHYTAVNAAQEQVFALDIPSARLWLRHNHMWAKDVWTH